MKRILIPLLSASVLMTGCQNDKPVEQKQEKHDITSNLKDYSENHEFRQSEVYHQYRQSTDQQEDMLNVMSTMKNDELEKLDRLHRNYQYSKVGATEGEVVAVKDTDSERTSQQIVLKIMKGHEVKFDVARTSGLKYREGENVSVGFLNAKSRQPMIIVNMHEQSGKDMLDMKDKQSYVLHRQLNAYQETLFEKYKDKFTMFQDKEALKQLFLYEFLPERLTKFRKEQR